MNAMGPTPTVVQKFIVGVGIVKDNFDFNLTNGRLKLSIS